MRSEYVRVNEVIEELREWFISQRKEPAAMDYITISGSGEPTLNTGIADLISRIKAFSSVKIAVITNASLLSDESVRREISGADLIVPSLDAVTQEIFEKIDRPYQDIKIGDIINGLILLRKKFKGKIWLEVMLAKGINDDIRHIRKLQEVIERINPDKVQINSPVRTASEAGVLPVAKFKLKKIKEILGEKAQII